MDTYEFTLSGVTLPEGGDPLGLWDVAAAEAVSFGDTSGAPQEPTWRIQLPESPAEAQRILRGKTRALELAQPDLAQAQRELERVDPATSVPSFSISDELFAPKSALRASVNQFRAAEVVSFGGLRLPAQIEDRDVYQQWVAFVERVRQMIAHYARVETVLGEQDVGLTTVGWTGNFATAWPRDVTAGGMRTHAQSVHLAMGSRLALIRVVSVVATGAAGLAVKASVPGGQLLLLPAVWKFVRDVLAELRKSWPQIEQLV